LSGIRADGFFSQAITNNPGEVERINKFIFSAVLLLLINHKNSIAHPLFLLKKNFRLLVLVMLLIGRFSPPSFEAKQDTAVQCKILMTILEYE